VENESAIAVEDAGEVDRGRGRTFEVRVPASTSNLGAGFDCFGLALQLYLTVRATIVSDASEPCRVRVLGEREGGAVALPRTRDNLIFRAMQLAAEREGLSLPPLRLAVHNELPLGRGLGSSAAAIIAGITLCSRVCEREITDRKVLRYALEMEGHADNIAPALHGGWVVTCLKPDGDVIVVKRAWPPDIKVIVVSPHAPLNTALARSALPDTIERRDAVYNIQRAALFGAALETGAYDLLWEAMKDRLHQAHRQPFVPGLAEALATPKQPGLVGLAVSGAGPSVIALASDHFTEIGEAIAERFRLCGTETFTRLLDVDTEGRKTRTLKRPRAVKR
jgi:homoserine kinase